MGTKRGRPKVSEFTEQCIAYTVIRLANRYNETYYKAWLRFTTHKTFRSLIEDHYKNTRDQKHWTDNLCGRRDAQRKFYSKHIRNWVNKRRGLGSLKDWTIYYKKFRLSGK